MAVMPLAVALLWPTMLPWLLAAAVPFILAWWAVRDARRVRWGAIDLVIRAARAARITRSGLPWPLAVVRMLVIVCAALAATRPFLGDHDRPSGRTVVAGSGATRIEIVTPGGGGDGAVEPLGRAIEAVARTRQRPSLPVDLVAIAEAGRPSADRRLIILGDGAMPDPDAAARLAAVVREGDSLLVCLGPVSVSAPVRPTLSAWLDDLAGVSVAGSLPLDDEAIESRDAVDRAPPAAFVTLPGPRVTRAAELFRGGDGRAGITVWARTASSGRPLVVEGGAGRGRVCVSALPLSLSAGDAGAVAWSDIAAWPAFVPFIDRLVSGLLPRDDAAAAMVRPRSRFAGLPLARPLLVCALVLAVLEAVVVIRRARAAGDRGGVLSLATRAFVIAPLVTMMALWGGRPAARPPTAPTPLSVAVVIDTSPSMATVDAVSAAPSAGPASRFRAALDALLLDEGGASVLDRLASERPVEIHVAAETSRRLGRYPAEVSADDLRRLAASPPAADASRLGDAVAATIEPRGVGAPAAVIVISDGAITGGASWAEAAGVAARRGVPCVAVPVGDDAATVSGPPSGFRFTSIETPAIWRPDERLSVAVRGVAATMSTADVVVRGEGTVAALVADPRPTASGYEYEGVFIVPPAAAVPPPAMLPLTLTSGDEDGHAAAASIVVADDPVRVLLIDRGPRYEVRFLERLLAGDPRYALTSRMLADHDDASLRFAATLPQSVADWNAFDVVVLGDVAVAGAPEAEAAAWESLREAVAGHGVGIAWLPGRRWAAADAGRGGWLPAAAGAEPVNATEATRPRRLRILPTARAAGWLPVAARGPDEGPPVRPRTFTQLPALDIRPTARVLAVMEADGQAEPSPAIVVARMGRGTVVGHFCDTWRWRGDEASGDGVGHARYWQHLLPQLAERHRLERLVAATIAVRPLDPVAGETVRVDVAPTRAATDLTGWELEIQPPDGPSRRLGCGEPLPGCTATLRLSGLAAGRHRLRVVPASMAGTDLPNTPIERVIVVNAPAIEQPGGPAGAAPMRMAIEAEGGVVIPLDRLGTLPDTIAGMARSPEDHAAGAGRWLTGRFAANLLLAAFIAACAAVWWPRPVSVHGAR
jgi:hypothetical protein